jgi:hypothetical protein
MITSWKAKRGFWTKLFVTPPQLIFSAVLIILLLIMNWNYFRPEHGRMGTLTDQEKFSGAAWDLQQTAGIYDYLPIWAKTAPKTSAGVVAEVMSGDGGITNMEKGTYFSKFNVNIETEEAQVRLSTFYFPGWKVFIKDGSTSKEIPIYIPDDEQWGRMWVKLPKGEYLVYSQLFNTPIRTWANIISFASWGVLIIYPFWKRRSA